MRVAVLDDDEKMLPYYVEEIASAFQHFGKANQKVKWSVVFGKSFVKLSRKTGKSITVTAKKKGKATVQAKCGNQKYKCQITIVNKAKQTYSTTDLHYWNYKNPDEGL